MVKMPDRMISAILRTPISVTDGSKSQMNGSSSTPIKAVNSSSTATSLVLKKRSTMYLSKWTEIAHKTGPEKAKTTQETPEATPKEIPEVTPVPCSARAAPCKRHNFAFLANRVAHGGGDTGL